MRLTTDHDLKRPIVLLAVAFFPWVCMAGLLTGYWMGRASAPTRAAGIGPTNAPAVATLQAQGNAPEAPAAGATFTLNQDVRVGDVRWKLLEAKDMGNVLPKGNPEAGNYSSEVKTNGKFVRLRFEIENMGKDQLSFTSVDLADGQGRSFTSTDKYEALSHIPNDEQCALDQLNPNLPKSCQVLFELPADAQQLRAVVGDMIPFGADDVLIETGL